MLMLHRADKTFFNKIYFKNKLLFLCHRCFIITAMNVVMTVQNPLTEVFLKDHKEILTEALKRFRESDEQSSFNRTSALSDIKFSRLGEQWDEKIKAQRLEDSRPCLTINKLPAFIRQVVNDARMQKPQIEIKPADSYTDVDTARIIDGLIKQIQRRSHADVAYDTALEHAVTGGFGFFRVSVDWANDRSFALEAKIERIANPLMVHWDTNTTGFNAEDWEYCFISDFLSPEEFKAKYPKAKEVSFEGDTRDGVNAWTATDGQIRVAEYFCKKYQKETLCLLSDGKTILKSELDADEEMQVVFALNGIEIVKEREIKTPKIIRYVINGIEILEEEEWAGSFIPVIPVWGEEVIVEGKRHLRSLIRDCKDPQSMFNFWRSATTELVALAPKAPYLVPTNGIAPKDKAKWEKANIKNFAYLEYNPQAGAMPQRQAFAGVPAGALQEAMNASDDIKMITGIYDASLGARSNETSGRAIKERKLQGSLSNFHFIDNLNRAIQYCGKVLVDIIPAVYSQQETIRIIGENNTEEVIRLANQNNSTVEEGTPLYDISTGYYDVEVKSGSAYSTQREETRETLIEIMARVPNAAALIGDVLMENMDFVGADKVAERLRALLPTQLNNQPTEQGLNPAQQQPLGGNI